MHAFSAPATRIAERVPIPLGTGTHEVDFWTLDADGVDLYFVEDPGLYGRAGFTVIVRRYGDNHIRFALLCRAALEISRRSFRRIFSIATTGRPGCCR